MQKARIKNFLSNLGCGSLQFELKLNLSELSIALQAFHEAIETGNQQHGMQFRSIKHADLHKNGKISCCDFKPKPRYVLASGGPRSPSPAQYRVIYHVTELIRYLSNEGSEIKDLKCLGISKIWMQGDDIHIQGSSNIVDIIKENLSRMNEINLTASGETRSKESFRLTILRKQLYDDDTPEYFTDAELKCQNNAATVVKGVASIVLFSVAVIALAGLISLPIPFIGISLGVALALGAWAAYSYSYYDDDQRVFNRANPIHYFDLTDVGDRECVPTLDAGIAEVLGSPQAG